MTASPDGKPVLTFATPADWEAWLEEQHDTVDGVWLQIAKKAAAVTTVTAPEALELALCFGWIDGQRRGLDETYFLQKYTPRRARSIWSRINRDKAVELMESGRMRPAGEREVQRAREDGRWDAAYEGQRTATVPGDLQAALDANPQAAAEFGRLDSRNRYAILHRVGQAKKPETRLRRISTFVEMLARGERLYP